MNKILSLFLAAFIIVVIIVVLAAVLWLSDSPTTEIAISHPDQENRNPQSQAAQLFDPANPSADSSSSIPLLFQKDDEAGYNLVCLINNPEGVGIEGALVTLESLDGPTYRHRNTTDASGECRLLALQPGNYQIIATVEGYSSAEMQMTLTASSERRQSCTLVLRYPTFSLQGRVLTHAGEAVSGATVTCIARNTNSTDPVSTPSSIVAVTQSQRNGAFQIDDLPSGNYQIVTDCEGYLESVRQIVLKQNQPIFIRLDRYARLDGMVIDDAKHPIAGATVSIFSSGKQGILMNSVQTQANGRFILFDLPPQALALRIEADGYQGTQQRIEINKSIHEIQVVLPVELFILQGMVVDAKTGQGIQDIAIELYDRPLTELFPRKFRETRSGGEGQFTFPDLLPAHYTVQLASSEFHRFPPASVDLPVSFEDVTGVILGLQAYGSVSGRVTDSEGKSVANAEVNLLIPLIQGSSVRTDEQGIYNFPYLAISRQIPKSGQETTRVLVYHAEYAAGYSEEFRFIPGERVDNVDVVLDQGFSLYGKVTTQQYRPIVGARICAQVFDRPDDRRESVSDAQGNYRIDYIPRTIPQEAYGGIQQIALGARADGFEYQLCAVPITGADTIHKNFILREAGQIEGIVQFPDGTPAPGAKLLLMGAQQQDTESDALGRFRFDNVFETSTLQIMAQFGVSRYRFPRSLQSEQEFFGHGAFFAYAIPVLLNDRHVRIVLQPENGIVGRVIDGVTQAPITEFKATLAYRFPLYDKYLHWSVREGTWVSPSPGEWGFSAPLPGDYLLTFEAEGYQSARYEISFYENNMVRSMDIPLTQIGQGVVFGALSPYVFHGNIKRLQLRGQGVDWAVPITLDSPYPFRNLGNFQVDHVPPGSYNLDCIYSLETDREIALPLRNFEVFSDQATNLGILDVSSIFVKPTPWPIQP